MAPIPTRTRRRRTIALVLCAALALALPSHAQPRGGGGAGGPPKALVAMQEQAVKALADARAFAREVLPTTAQLNQTGDWKYPWEVPPQANSQVRTDEQYWARYAKDGMAPGLTAGQATEFLDGLLAELGPAAEREGMTPRDAVLAMLVGTRAGTTALGPGMDEQLAASARAIEAAVAAGGGGGGGEPRTRADAARAQRAALDAMFEPYKALDLAGAKAAYVKQATLVRRSTAMQFYRSNNWAALGKARSDADIVNSGTWFGAVKVSVMLVDPARAGEMADVTDPKALEGRLSGSFKRMVTSMVQFAQRQADREIERIRQSNAPDAPAQMQRRREKYEQERDAANRASLEVIRREFGANSYVIRMTGVSPDTPGLSASIYSGWVRNGNAVVKIEFGGNFPPDVMLKEMDHFLSEMDARTGSYGGLGGDLGGDLDGGPPKRAAAGASGVNPAPTPGSANAALPDLDGPAPATGTPPARPPEGAMMRAVPPPTDSLPPLDPPAATGVAPAPPPPTDGASLPPTTPDAPIVARPPVAPPESNLPPLDPPVPVDPGRPPQPIEPPAPIDPPRPTAPARLVPTAPTPSERAAVDRAGGLASKGDLRGALAACDDLLAGAPGLRDARMLRATTRMRTNDLRGALDDFNALVDASPNDYESLRARSALLIALGDTAAALRDARALIRAQPDSPAAQVAYGRACLFAGQKGAGREALARVGREHPEYVTGMYRAAGGLLRDGSYAIARQQYLTVLGARPDYANASYGCGLACVRMGLREEAIRHFERYLQVVRTGEYAERAKAELARLKSNPARAI